MGEVIAFSRAAAAPIHPIAGDPAPAASRAVVDGGQVVANIDGHVLVGRYDLSLDRSIVSYRHIELTNFSLDLIDRGGRKFMPAKARVALTGRPTKMARDIELGGLNGPDILVGRDLAGEITDQPYPIDAARRSR